jgi:hypothetical protein
VPFSEKTIDFLSLIFLLGRNELTLLKKTELAVCRTLFQAPLHQRQNVTFGEYHEIIYHSTRNVIFGGAACGLRNRT